MKTKKITYWITTSLLSLGFLSSAVMYLSKSPELVQGFTTVGLPLYLIPFLGVAKLLAPVGLLNPWFPKLREWTYAGYTFVLLGATWIHITTGTAFIAPLVFLALVGTSYYFLPYRDTSHKTRLETV